MARILFDLNEVNAGGLVFGLAEKSYSECLVKGTGDDVTVAVTFSGVLGYRKSYYKDTAFADYENKLFELPQSEWLDFIQERAATGNRPTEAEGIRHFVVNPAEEGSSYEVICRSVRMVVDDPLDRTKKGTPRQWEF